MNSIPSEQNKHHYINYRWNPCKPYIRKLWVSPLLLEKLKISTPTLAQNANSGRSPLRKTGSV